MAITFCNPVIGPITRQSIIFVQINTHLVHANANDCRLNGSPSHISRHRRCSTVYLSQTCIPPRLREGITKTEISNCDLHNWSHRLSLLDWFPWSYSHLDPYRHAHCHHTTAYCNGFWNYSPYNLSVRGWRRSCASSCRLAY